MSRTHLDGIDNMRLNGDIDGLRTAQLEAWGEWRRIDHERGIDNTRELYRECYAVEHALDRIVRAIGHVEGMA